MGWLINAIAQPFLWVGKQIISIVAEILKDFVYETFIMTILKLINFLELIFSFLSVRGPNVFLFNMKSIDGKTILSNNFFTHPSPLQKFYITIVAIAGIIGVALIMLGTARYVGDRKKGSSFILNPARNFLVGVFSFTIIPVITIFLLSGIGAITQVFSGKAPNPPSINDIKAYQSKLPNLISKIKYGAKNNFTGDIKEIYAYGLDRNTGEVIIKHGSPEDFGQYDKSNFIAAGSLEKDKFNVLQYQSMFNNGGINKEANKSNKVAPYNAASARGKNLISPLEEVPINKKTKIFEYIQNMMAWGSNITNSSSDQMQLKANSMPKGINSIENNNALVQSLQKLKRRYDELFNKSDEKDIAVFGTTMGKYSKDLLRILSKTNDIIALSKDEKNNKNAQELRNYINKMTRVQEKLSDFKMAFEDYISKYQELDVPNVILKDTNMASAEMQKLWTQANHLLNLSTIYNEYIQPSFAIKNGIAKIGKPKTIGDIMWVINELLVGSKNNTSKNGIPIALPNLKQQLSTQNDSSVSITIYQIASGKNDINWDSKPASSSISWGNMLIGLIAGGLSIYFLCQLVIYAGMRIFEIGVLFLSGPFFVVSSAVDNGERTKNWLRLIGAKIFSIVAVVIAFSMIQIGINGLEKVWKLDEGQKILETARNMSFLNIHDADANEWLGRNLLKLIIIISGLIAAHKGGTLISSAFGVDAGIAESMGHIKTLGSATKALKSGVKSTFAGSKAIGKGISKGYKTARDNNVFSAAGRENWANRVNGVKERIQAAKSNKQEYTLSKIETKAKKNGKLTNRQIKKVTQKYLGIKDYSKLQKETRDKRMKNFFNRNKAKERARSMKFDKKDGKL